MPPFNTLQLLPPHFFHLEGIAAALAIIGSAISFIKWAYRSMRTLDTTTGFVKSMATNHLPHIYDRLSRIDDRVGLDRIKEPPINFADGQ